MNAHDSKMEDCKTRDQLAVTRTVLANERTLLAFIRTALTLLIAGVTFVQFFPADFMRWLGIVFVILGIAALIIGAYRYNRIKGRLKIYI